MTHAAIIRCYSCASIGPFVRHVLCISLHTLILCKQWHHFVKKNLCWPAASAGVTGVAWCWGQNLHMFHHFPFGVGGSVKLLKGLAMTYRVVHVLWTLVATPSSDQGRTTYGYIIEFADFWMFLHLQQTLFYQQLRNEFANFVATHSLSLENYSVQNFPPNLGLVFPRLFRRSKNWMMKNNSCQGGTACGAPANVPRPCFAKSFGVFTGLDIHWIDRLLRMIYHWYIVYMHVDIYFLDFISAILLQILYYSFLFIFTGTGCQFWCQDSSMRMFKLLQWVSQSSLWHFGSIRLSLPQFQGRNPLITGAFFCWVDD